MHKRRTLNRIITLAACCFAQFAQAEPSAGAPTRPAQELWINPGFYAYHFQRDKNLNDNATGFGIEYRFSEKSAFTAGIYHNSNWRTSHYLGYYWQPWVLGPVHLGAVIGAIDGYPYMWNGNWFPAVLPAASVEYGRIGLNIYLIPTYKNRIAGSVSFQLKLKVF